MEVLNLKVINGIGIHAKAAANIVNIASQYESNIILKHNEIAANMKSILNILALGVKNNEDFIIEITGADEYNASIDIMSFLKANDIAI